MLRFRTLALGLIVSAQFVASPASSQTPEVPDWQTLKPDEAVAGCDKYAAHPMDPMKPDNVTGVASDAEVANDAAYVYCHRAFASYQDNPRLAFQWGRVNLVRNPRSIRQPLQMFKIAYRGGSEIAGQYIARIAPQEFRKLTAAPGQSSTPAGEPAKPMPSNRQVAGANWISDLAAEIDSIEASYNRLVGRIGCCADSKEKVEEYFPSIKASLKKADERKAKGRLYCSSINLLEMEVGLFRSWLWVLSKESQQPKNQGSISGPDASSLAAIIERVKRSEKSIATSAVQMGCPKS